MAELRLKKMNDLFDCVIHQSFYSDIGVLCFIELLEFSHIAQSRLTSHLLHVHK